MTDRWMRDKKSVWGDEEKKAEEVELTVMTKLRDDKYEAFQELTVPRT